MARKVRHLQHGNVTVSINGPAELVDDFMVQLHLHSRRYEGAGTIDDALPLTTPGRALAELEEKAETIGGEFSALLHHDEAVWKTAIGAGSSFEITVFA